MDDLMGCLFMDIKDFVYAIFVAENKILGPVFG